METNWKIIIQQFIPTPRMISASENREQHFKLDPHFPLEVYISSDCESSLIIEHLSTWSSWKVIQTSNEPHSEDEIRNKIRIEKILPFEKKDAQTNEEAYKLTISQEEIIAQGNTEKAIINAFLTLRQIISIISKADINQINSAIQLPTIVVEDFPQFPMRGFMLDVGRNFVTLETLKNLIDYMAFYKMNVFHWHLTDHPGWRIECKVYPQLNSLKSYRSTRDPGKFYSYAEIRDLFYYARIRNVQIIPEIDIPGHSTCFRKAMKYPMGTFLGQRALTKIFKEFFEEIPIEICPYIHIGSDEVYIPRKKSFIRHFLNLCRDFGRIPIMWNPGLPPDENAILQNWGSPKEHFNNPILDSAAYYINNQDPWQIILTIFRKYPGEPNYTQPQTKGAILCAWPDVNVDEKANIFRQNPILTSMLPYIERLWTSRPSYYVQDAQEQNLVNENIQYADNEELRNTLSHFEQKIINHFGFHAWLQSRESWFIYNPQTTLKWNVLGPFSPSLEDAKILSFLEKENPRIDSQPLTWIRALGGTLNIQSRIGFRPILECEAGAALIVTNIQAPKSGKYPFLIGFESVIRSNRRHGGLPQLGKWDAHGSQVYLNNSRLSPPDFEHAGEFDYRGYNSWHRKNHEIPFVDEEFYWLRKPYVLELNEGHNILVVITRKSFAAQNWTFSCIPQGDYQNQEDTNLKFSYLH